MLLKLVINIYVIILISYVKGICDCERMSGNEWMITFISICKQTVSHCFTSASQVHSLTILGLLSAGSIFL